MSTMLFQDQYAQAQSLINCQKFKEAEKMLQETINQISQQSEHNGLHINCFQSLAKLHIDMGHFKKALEEIDQALTLTQTVKGPAKTDIQAHIYLLQGELYSEMSLVSKAQKYYHKAFDLFPESNIEGKVVSLRGLGKTYQDNFEFSKAQKYFKDAQKLIEEHLQDNQKASFEIEFDIGKLKISMTDPIEANKSLDRALAKGILLYGREHHEIAKVKYHKAIVLGHLNLQDQAIKELKQTLRLVEELNPLKAAVLLEFASVYESISFNVQAASYMKEALELAKKTFQEEAPLNLVYFYHKMSDIAHCAERFKESLKWCQDALEICEKQEEPDCPLIVSCYTRISRIKRDLEKYTESFEYNKRCLDLLVPKFGEENTQVASVYYQKGHILLAQDKPTEALRCFKKQHLIDKNIYTFPSPRLYDRQHELGRVLYECEQVEEGLKNLHQSLKSQQKYYGGGHPAMIDPLKNISICYQEFGLLKDAQDHLLGAVQIITRFFSEEHYSLFNLYKQLGSIKEALEEFEEGQQYFDKALELYYKGIVEDSFDAEDLFTRLGDREIDDDPEKALEYYQQALKIAERFRNTDSYSLGSIYLKLGNALMEQQDSTSQECFKWIRKGMKIMLQFDSMKNDTLLCYCLNKALFDEKTGNFSEERKNLHAVFHLAQGGANEKERWKARESAAEQVRLLYEDYSGCCSGLNSVY